MAVSDCGPAGPARTGAAAHAGGIVGGRARAADFVTPDGMGAQSVLH
jgi:hypothetical protein